MLFRSAPGLGPGQDMQGQGPDGGNFGRVRVKQVFLLVPTWELGDERNLS